MPDPIKEVYLADQTYAWFDGNDAHIRCRGKQIKINPGYGSYGGVWKPLVEFMDRVDKHMKLSSRCSWDSQCHILMDLLSLAMDKPPTIDMICRWTITECSIAESWAVAAHLHASDNDVVVPRKPDFLY